MVPFWLGVKTATVNAWELAQMETQLHPHQPVTLSKSWEKF
jgi:hypothetical protein